MLYLYEEYTDFDESNETNIIVSERECKQSDYSHTHNFIELGEWAGQSGTTVSHGMLVYWAMIYMGH